MQKLQEEISSENDPVNKLSMQETFNKEVESYYGEQQFLRELGMIRLNVIPFNKEDLSNYNANLTMCSKLKSTSQKLDMEQKELKIACEEMENEIKELTLKMNSIDESEKLRVNEQSDREKKHKEFMTSIMNILDPIEKKR